MPELPDLENIKDYLNACLSGVAIEEVEVRQPAVSLFPDALRGKVFQPVRRRGKFLLLPFTNGDVLTPVPGFGQGFCDIAFTCCQPMTCAHASLENRCTNAEPDGCGTPLDCSANCTGIDVCLASGDCCFVRGVFWN